MPGDFKFLNKTMEEVFAPLTNEDALVSSREVVRRYLAIDNNSVGSIKWAEFETNGTFVRGGISNARMMSSHLISSESGDRDIDAIIEHAQNTELKIGDLVLAPNGEGHYWYIPFRPPAHASNPVMRIRIILLTQSLFEEILDLFNEAAVLTPSEKRIVHQIVIGKNPSSAAKSDNVSIETKRSQLKAAMAKLDCHSQAELVRLMVSQLVHLISLCETETSQIQMAEQFNTQFFGQRGRLSVQYLPSGRSIRYWEFGPANGRALYVMHGYMFPFLVLDAQHELHEHNLRLVMPMRNGYLDDRIAGGANQLEQLANENLEDLLAFAQCVFDKPVPILGHNMGSIYAMQLASTAPELFTKAIVASIMGMHKKSDNPSVANRFATGIRKLTGDSGILEVAARHIQGKIFASKRITQNFLQRLFRNSPDDLDVLNGVRGSGAAYDWFRQMALHSVVGFSSDLKLISTLIENIIREVPLPIILIHGANDPYTSTTDLKEYAAQNPLAKCTMLASGGHYVSASHPYEFWQAVSAGIDK